MRKIVEELSNSVKKLESKDLTNDQVNVLEAINVIIDYMVKDSSIT